MAAGQDRATAPMFPDADIVLSYGVVAITSETGDLLYHVPSQRVIRRTNGQPAGSALRELLRDNYIPAGSVMCRRDALVRAGGFCQPDDVPTTDYPTWLELCRLGRFAATTEMLGYQRQHADQVTTSMRKEMDFALDWGPRFVARLPDAEREALGVTVDEARRIQLQRHAHMAYEHGRAALRAGDDRVARGRFRDAFRDGELRDAAAGHDRVRGRSVQCRSRSGRRRGPPRPGEMHGREGDPRLRTGRGTVATRFALADRLPPRRATASAADARPRRRPALQLAVLLRAARPRAGRGRRRCRAREPRVPSRGVRPRRRAPARLAGRSCRPRPSSTRTAARRPLARALGQPAGRAAPHRRRGVRRRPRPVDPVRGTLDGGDAAAPTGVPAGAAHGSS